MLLSDVTTTVVPRQLAALPYERWASRRSERLRAAAWRDASSDRRGALHWLAHGYYVVAPQDQTGTGWMPTLEAAAADIATADFGPANAILMRVSTARLHGRSPRARFVKRDTARLDAERMSTELGPPW